VGKDFTNAVKESPLLREPVSRRRLLKLAAYSVPAATVLNVASSVRVLAQSPGVCVPCEGTGLWLDVYDNPWWRGFPTHVGVEAPCHDAPWYPLTGDPTFSARWVGNLCISDPGSYSLRVRGVDWAQGLLFDPESGNFLFFDVAGLTLNLQCQDYPLDLYFRHTTSNLSDAEVHLEWIPPGGGGWVCVPEANLRWA